MATESTFLFSCHDADLVGIVHGVDGSPTTGMLMVVAGGPQYRVGAHRQFVSLSRYLAAQAIPVMRFDYRGMGDSEGPHRGFMSMDADIRSAIDAFFTQVPSLERVVLYGECESASAAMFYAHQDPRVAKLLLLNPWVYTDEGRSRAYVKHYYWSRVRSAEFWRKVFGGKFNITQSLSSFATNLLAVIRLRLRPGPKSDEADDIRALPLPDATVAGLERFKNQIEFVVSGRDIIAREFDDTIAANVLWQRIMKSERVRRHDIDEADHSFTDPGAWRELAKIAEAASR
jgi:exosortase A-associated hydrolase 1